MRIGVSGRLLQRISRFVATNQLGGQGVTRCALFSAVRSVNNSAAEPQQQTRKKLAHPRSTRPSDAHFVNKLPNMLARTSRLRASSRVRSLLLRGICKDTCALAMAMAMAIAMEERPADACGNA
jgi:hypothetical protein